MNYELAHKLFSYCAETGRLSRMVSRGKALAGTEAGTVMINTSSGKKYRIINHCGKIHRAHRIAWLMHYGKWPENQIDHINGNGLDNRINNLRDVVHIENGRNQLMPKNNTSGVCGVNWCKQTNKWRAEIIVNGKKKCLGRHDLLSDAASAREAAERLYGFHPNHGKRAAG